MESDLPLGGPGRSIHIGVAPSTHSHSEIDGQKDDSLVAVLEESGELVAKQRVENCQFNELANACEGSKATLEVTGNYFSIYDVLDQHLEVAVADPPRTKAIGAADVKNDLLDASSRTALQGKHGCGE